MSSNNYNFKINKTKIGKDYPCYFIADIAANHDSDLIKAKELIFAAAENGANAAKFQHFQAETIVSDYGFKSLRKKSSHQSTWKKSVFEVYKSASINLDWTLELKETCRKAKIDFFTSPYSLELVDLVNKHVPAHKIGSGDITWHEIVEYIAKKQKPYILATGASNFSEVKTIVKKCLKINKKLAILQCNTNYTANDENFKFISLNVLKTYAKHFPNCIIGLSDHTLGYATVLGAITLGAKIIEKHFTLDNKKKGPDHFFSMNPKSWFEMIKASRQLEYALGSDKKIIEKNEIDTVVLQRRAIRVKNDLFKGKILKKEDFIFLRPCPKGALEPYNFKKLLNKKLNKNILKDDIVKLVDVSN